MAKKVDTVADLAKAVQVGLDLLKNKIKDLSSVDRATIDNRITELGVARNDIEDVASTLCDKSELIDKEICRLREYLGPKQSHMSEYDDSLSIKNDNGYQTDIGWETITKRIVNKEAIRKQAGYNPSFSCNPGFESLFGQASAPIKADVAEQLQNEGHLHDAVSYDTTEQGFIKSFRN